MAGFLDKIKKAFNFDDDDDAFDDYEEEELKKTEEAKKEQLRANSVSSRSNSDSDSGKSYDSGSGYSSRSSSRTTNYASAYIDRDTNAKSLKIDRPYGSKFIPISTTRLGNEVCIMKPISFNDSQDICDVLLSSRIAVVNLEDLDVALAQRIIDFLSGSVYALNGKLFNIANLIFIIAPDSVDISGDYEEIAEQTGFDVPVINS